MKILVDHQIFLSQKYGGISNYHSTIHQVINDMQTEHSSTILALGSDNEYVDPQLNILRPLNIRGKKILRTINQYTMSRMMGGYDVFHPSYYDNYFLQWRKRLPFVLTVHDMIPERNFFYDQIGLDLIKSKKNLIYKADRLIAISEATKADMLEFYDIDPDRIDVIHHGYPTTFDRFLTKPGGSVTAGVRPYILFVGNRYAYKNFDLFVESIADLLIKHDLQLEVVGPLPSQKEQQLIAGLNIVSHVSFRGHVSEEELFHYYHNAFCFAFPSLEEGFGIPLLEAATADCPVVCSDIGIFREVADDSALYFDPRSRESIHQQVEKLVLSDSLRADLIRCGHENLKRFSWKKAARKTLDTYRRAAGLDTAIAAVSAW